MYYEEKEIDGILNFRTSPTGEFREISKVQLTAKINRLKSQIRILNEKIFDLEHEYEAS